MATVAHRRPVPAPRAPNPYPSQRVWTIGRFPPKLPLADRIERLRWAGGDECVDRRPRPGRLCRNRRRAPTAPAVGRRLRNSRRMGGSRLFFNRRRPGPFRPARSVRAAGRRSPDVRPRGAAPRRAAGRFQSAGFQRGMARSISRCPAARRSGPHRHVADQPRASDAAGHAFGRVAGADSEDRAGVPPSAGVGPGRGARQSPGGDNPTLGRTDSRRGQPVPPPADCPA